MFHSEILMDDESWKQDVLSSLPAVLNQSADSNNQKILRIISAYTNNVKNEILHLHEQMFLKNMSGKFLTDYAKDWGVTRIDDDDDFLKFQIRIQQLKGRLGVTDDDFKLLIATVLDIDVSSFDVVPGDDPESVKVLNLPFNFTDNKQEIKRKILTDSLQQMLPLEYLLVEVQFQTISNLSLYVGVVAQTRTVTKAEMTNLRSRTNNIYRHIYIGTAAQQFRVTDAPLKGAD